MRCSFRYAMVRNIMVMQARARWFRHRPQLLTSMPWFFRYSSPKHHLWVNTHTFVNFVSLKYPGRSPEAAVRFSVHSRPGKHQLHAAILLSVCKFVFLLSIVISCRKLKWVLWGGLTVARAYVFQNAQFKVRSTIPDISNVINTKYDYKENALCRQNAKTQWKFHFPYKHSEILLDISEYLTD